MVKLYSEEFKLDWNAPDFSLQNIDGSQVKLSELIDKKGLLIVFTCNHCPYAKASWPILDKLFDKFGSEISFVAINSNDETAYPDDSFDAMVKFVSECNIGFPYLRDKDQSVAKKYQAQCTPDPFLFRVDGNVPKLYYHGRLNDNWQYPESVTTNDMENAMKNLVDGKPAAKKQYPSMGCSIKWKEDS